MLGTDPFLFMDHAGRQHAKAMLDPTVNDLPNTFTFRLVDSEGRGGVDPDDRDATDLARWRLRGGFALVTNISANVRANQRRNIAESMFEKATESAPIGQNHRQA